MVSGQNLKVIALHLLFPYPSLFGWVLAFARSSNLQLSAIAGPSSYSHIWIWPRLVALICYHLELKVLVFSINQLRFIKEKC